MFMSARKGSNNFNFTDFSNQNTCKNNVWLNLSSAYGTDENFTAYGTNENITQQGCLSTRGIIGHSNAAYFSHGAGFPEDQKLLMRGIGVHHNFYDSCNHRMPLIGSNNAAVINTVTSNADYYFSSFAKGCIVDYIGNEMLEGANSSSNPYLIQSRHAISNSGVNNRDPSIMVKDNVSSVGHDHGDASQWSMVHDYVESGAHSTSNVAWERTSKIVDSVLNVYT